MITIPALFFNKMEAPDFIKTTQADILNRFIANYEMLAKKKLQPAQAEQMIINAGGYEIYLQALRAQSAAIQNLVQFATGATLDGLARRSGVTRLPEQAATCEATLTLIAGHGNLVIPAATRIQSQDGLATFLTRSPTPVAANTDTVTVDLICDTPGVIGNNYVAGKISTILDPQPYLVSAINSTESTGGSDIETDENLRQRIYDAPNAFSVAGSKGAYRYLAKSASPLIIDVAVPESADGGVVEIYPLIEGKPTPQEILDAVYTICNPETVRPLTDKVVPIAPTFNNYSVDIGLILYSTADAVATLTEAYKNVTELTRNTGRKLNVDAVVSQLSAAASVKGSVYKAIVNSPANDIVVDETAVAYCTGINIHIVGLNSDL